MRWISAFVEFIENENVYWFLTWANLYIALRHIFFPDGNWFNASFAMLAFVWMVGIKMVFPPNRI